MNAARRHWPYGLEMRRGSLRLRRLHHAGVLGMLAPTGADQAKAWPTLSKTDSSKLESL